MRNVGSKGAPGATGEVASPGHLASVAPGTDKEAAMVAADLAYLLITQATVYAELTGCALEEVMTHANLHLNAALLDGWQPPHSTTPF